MRNEHFYAFEQDEKGIEGQKWAMIDFRIFGEVAPDVP
jgi:hypothetical protein